MDKKELKELASLVGKELSVVDFYKHPIPKSDISDVRNYFNKNRRFDLKIFIESSYVSMPQDLYKKYLVIFCKRRK